MSKTLPQTNLPKMSSLEKAVFDLFAEFNPQSLYSLGLDEYADKFTIYSEENVQLQLKKIAALKKRCGPKDVVVRKLLDSIETGLLWDEPGPGVGVVVDVLSTQIIKEGIKTEHLKRLVDLLFDSVDASLKRYAKKKYYAPIRILCQYMVFSANEILDLLIRESNNHELREKSKRLKDKVKEFGESFAVSGFTDGEFSEVVQLMKQQGADLGRERFYRKALRYAFDYKESPSQLEAKALKWISEDLPKLKKATRELSKKLGCANESEAVSEILKSRPGVGANQALTTTSKIRPIVQALVAESIVGINPKYDTQVIETPPYLTAIIPSAAAQGFDALTDKASQRYYLTTDPKRDPPKGFADLVNVLVHEEYGHCVHFSNTAAKYNARATICELLPSLHSGTTSEGLAFQRELEFLDLLERLSKKKESDYTEAERDYVKLCDDYGGFKETLLELEFTTYKQRIVRFLRVVGDSRINSGKQDLLKFLQWAERRTGLAQRTVFYQIFPAHEGIFPGYATCYAIVGQDIRQTQEKIKNDPKKMVAFNAYATSMGYPARSVYTKRLKAYAKSVSRK
ncbi:MAG: hypothetical protein JRN20_20665 [Nitrososphaerota archaeon]|nr:hypothetical protein [Nitrososphaerota archaeon]